MFALREEYHEGQTEPLMVLFRIISRRSWDDFQNWKRAFPGSHIEHLRRGTGFYVLIIPAGGVWKRIT
jgi:hypothetical protein